ncbi:GumC family protein [Selenihalanaerobacter shriftii]|uniref:Polysaccharide chain length determinant protein, PEP-CTERM locus subfamily n=1 Tax=Selenihalanaerobacter shriftii TaxID=142842 RepID=A0A1T4KVP6_9FIRM|nr:Wzz/FepE/Etk N-terminal domain-containing protein [Selenihalanaerobacter shriftii]SJZ46481.1 polysaccharide chain length determinant protein, PEP-CTERM locus subfamily [Selenihalanaerobacter shriftii]
MDNLSRNTTRFEEEMVEIDLREYADIIWKRKKIIIGLLLVALISSYIISGLMTKIYETSTLVMVKEDNGMESLFKDQMIPFSNSNDKIATYTQILKSRTIINQVIKKLDLRNKETRDLIKAKALRQKISVSSREGSQLITINVTYPDPIMAKRIANTLVKEFKEQNQQMNRSDLHGAGKFISEQLSNVKAKLAKLENDLLEYKNKEGVVLPEEQGKAALDKLTELEMAKAKAEVELKQGQASLDEVKSNLKEQDRSMISTRMISKNPLIQAYQKELFQLEIKLSGLNELYTEHNPQVIQIKNKIKEVKGRLAKVVKEIVSSKTEVVNPIYQSLKKRIITLQTKIIATQVQVKLYVQQIKDIEEELSTLPKKELTLARLQRESKVTESIYTMLMEKKEEIQIQEVMKTSDIIVVDSAIVNEEPIKPNTKLNIVIAAMLVIFVGLGIIFLIEYLDRTVKEEKDIERLTGLPVLGVIPKFDEVDHSQGYGRGDGDE